MPYKEIVLTDEEILYHWTLPSLISSTEYGVLKAVAKAQLKEIHNWGEEQCQGHHTSGIWFKRRECTKCWQALQDEVKDAT